MRSKTLFLTFSLIYFAGGCNGKVSSDDRTEKGEVSEESADTSPNADVNGFVDDEFVVAQDSAKISGSNLTQTTPFIRVETVGIGPNGLAREIIQEFPDPVQTFKSKIPANVYIVFWLRDKVGAVMPPYIPDGTGPKTISVYINSQSNMSAQIFQKLLELPGAEALIKDKTLDISGILKLGADAAATNASKPGTVDAASVDRLAANILRSNQQILKELTDKGITPDEISKIYSDAFFDVFDSNKVDPKIKDNTFDQRDAADAAADFAAEATIEKSGKPIPVDSASLTMKLIAADPSVLGDHIELAKEYLYQEYLSDLQPSIGAAGSSTSNLVATKLRDIVDSMSNSEISSSLKDGSAQTGSTLEKFETSIKNADGDSAALESVVTSFSNADQPPVFTYSSNQNLSGWSGMGSLTSKYIFSVANGTSNGTVSFLISDQDTDSSSLTLSCQSAPAWVAIDNGATKISFSPSIGDVGTGIEFSCKANDGISDSNSIYFSSTVTGDTTAPPDLTSFNGVTGGFWEHVDLTIDFPADVSDYDSVKIYRTTLGSATTGVVAPACGTGTLITSIVNFTTDPFTFTDDTGDPDKYFSYRACIYDAALNETSSAVPGTAIDVKSKVVTTELSHLSAGSKAGSPNVVDIGPDTTDPWIDLSGGSKDGDLAGFNYGTADSGWDGVGSVADPYALKFDGTDDSVSIPSMAPRAYSIWFNVDTFTGTLYEDFLFFAWDNSAHVANGQLYAEYNNSSFHSTHIKAGVWYHLVITNDNVTARFYLNGREFASEAQTASGTNTHYIGSDNLGSNFDGSIGEFHAFADNLTASDVENLYLEQRTSYFTDPLAIAIDEIVPASSGTSGGESFTIHGWNFSNVNDVTFDGVAAQSFTVESNGRITGTTPAHGVGWVDVVVTNGTAPDTIVGGFYFTNTPLDNVLVFLDAANANRGGARGCTHSNDVWKPIAGDLYVELQNFTLPCDGNSGWEGNGATINPYRLKIDNVDDRIDTDDMAPRSYSVWFNADTISGSVFDDYLFYTYSSSDVYLANGELSAQYNGSARYSVKIDAGKWYHLAVTNDGTTASFYLNGTAFGSEAEVPMAVKSHYIGHNDTGDEFDGSIAEFRAYSDGLSSLEVATIFAEGRGRFPDLNHTIFVTSSTTDGNIGGLEAADINCTALADAASMIGPYKALLSDSTQNASNRIVTTGIIYNNKTVPEKVADDSVDLWSGSLDSAIVYDESEANPGSVVVWTGSDAFGNDSGFTCSDFGSTAGNGTSGDNTSATSSWIDNGTISCATSTLRYYCISQ